MSPPALDADALRRFAESIGAPEPERPPNRAMRRAEAKRKPCGAHIPPTPETTR